MTLRTDVTCGATSGVACEPPFEGFEPESVPDPEPLSVLPDEPELDEFDPDELEPVELTVSETDVWLLEG